MKKEKMKELLTELRDREFTLKECIDLFDAINYYLMCRKAYDGSLGTDSESFESEHLASAAETLQNLLDSDGLNYTIDEILLEL